MRLIRLAQFLEIKYGLKSRAFIQDGDIWASKKPREDRIIIEYLVRELGNRQIEISFLDAQKLSRTFKRYKLEVGKKC